MAVTLAANATVVGTPNGQGGYTYTVTLNNTGSSTIGTFWFAWVPGQDYMTANPSAIGSPAGWGDQVTTASYAGGTGYAIEWTANTVSSDIQAGDSSSSFSFTSSESPTQLAANSPFDSKPPSTTSFVYQGAPLVGPGFNFTVAVECFREGTRIRTPRGDVAIETLRPGDLVATATGEPRPITWIGRRHIDCRAHPNPALVWPVRVTEGGLGPRIPSADLFLSPDHALFFDGVLVPVKYLVNRRTIASVPADTVTWYHLELAAHEVILAEGAAAESRPDTGDHAAFESAAVPPAAPVMPDRGMTREAGARWPLLVTGPRLDTIRQRIARRSWPEVVAPPFPVRPTGDSRPAAR